MAIADNKNRKLFSKYLQFRYARKIQDRNSGIETKAIALSLNLVSLQQQRENKITKMNNTPVPKKGQ